MSQFEGPSCGTCGNPLAEDQRYCLECGARRGPVRAALPQEDHLLVVGEERPDAGARWQRFGGVWGVAALLLVALAAGVVIGRSGDDAPAQAAAPIVRISGAPVAAAAPTGPTGVTAAVQQTAAADEWPAGQAGFTVQLALLDKATTSQEAANAAKADAATKGATEVGVLDGDAHGLDAGKLVLYSKVSTTRKQAAANLKDLTAAYPDAKVVQVTAVGGDTAAATDTSGTSTTEQATKAALDAQQNQSVEEAQKAAKKKPKTTVLPGKAPPKDNKAAGGGSDEETIG